MKDTFLSNGTDLKFINKLKKSLEDCISFSFSVSFIKIAGLSLIEKEIESALRRGVKGKLITSTYQNFTDIPSLEKFLFFSNTYNNFECHLELNNFGECGFHSKGYLFEYADSYEVIIGSSNITRYALLKNIEWNISIYDKNQFESYNNALDEFNYLWAATKCLSREIIKQYMVLLDYAIEKWDMDYITYLNDKQISPNYMQKKALKEIRRYRDMGIKRALIIAATGSGKTYLAAFDARNFGAKKLLFVVHRDTILNDALITFSKVFKDNVTYGIYNGENKQIDKDFIFASNMIMSKNLNLFKKDEFDYIVIDEVHHAVASTYKKIINYFEPNFMLGLTATPERLDNASVFELFEENVPYELRLRDALINDLIVPFKYYGISDDLIDYSTDDSSALIRQISSSINCKFISENIEKYRPIGKLKAIGFCRSVEHARLMFEQMTNFGYSSTYLTGRNDTGERLKAFSDLQDDNNSLEIIFTVDILNEGIDVPAINMVLFLRPTESSTIFIQQLGRGLRKYSNKEFLTVIDFIGNSYQRSVQIAIALGTLSANSSVDKRLLENYVNDDFKALDLPIEINIDEKSKEEILKAIEKTNFNSLQFLKQDYFNFKKYLNINYPPKHIDFINSDISCDLMRFINVYGSYYDFLLKINEENICLFSSDEHEFIRFTSSFMPLIRPYEYLIIKALFLNINKFNDIKNYITEKVIFSEVRFEHALNNLFNEFYSEKEKILKKQFFKKENDCIFLMVDTSNQSFVDYILDILDYGLIKYDIDYGEWSEDLKPLMTYTRSTLLQSLCNHTFASREGIIWNNGNIYIFIDLKKDLSKDEWLLYEDKFISSKILQWESQTETTLTNLKGRKLIDQREAHVFVRKIVKENGIVMPYIYFGKGIFTNPRESSNIKKSLLFDVILANEVPDYLQYEFQIPKEEI